tara:strand:+ start:807 stop:1235 length:429 start_codon:yes stop_codon:yes gene_type:complete
MYKQHIRILFFLIFFIFSQAVVSKELKSLNELLNLQNDANPSSSIIMMQRCAAIYGAMYFVNPSDSKSKEYENRYKIFLQSAVTEDIRINGTNEDEAYKKQLEEFKANIAFFIQIFLQNNKIHNTFLGNHWVKNDFEICKKY